MEKNKTIKTKATKVPAKVAEVPVKPVAEVKIAKIVAEIQQLDEANLNILRGILGTRSMRSGGARVSGSVKATDKSIDEKLCQQMKVLIKALPKDKAVDTKTWADLAIKGGLVTQQPPERIVAYYKKSIVNLGYAIAVN